MGIVGVPLIVFFSFIVSVLFVLIGVKKIAEKFLEGDFVKIKEGEGSGEPDLEFSSDDEDPVQGVKQEEKTVEYDDVELREKEGCQVPVIDYTSYGHLKISSDPEKAKQEKTNELSVLPAERAEKETFYPPPPSLPHHDDRFNNNDMLLEGSFVAEQSDYAILAGSSAIIGKNPSGVPTLNTTDPTTTTQHYSYHDASPLSGRQRTTKTNPSSFSFPKFKQTESSSTKFKQSTTVPQVDDFGSNATIKMSVTHRKNDKILMGMITSIDNIDTHEGGPEFICFHVRLQCPNGTRKVTTHWEPIWRQRFAHRILLYCTVYCTVVHSLSIFKYFQHFAPQPLCFIC